MAYMKPSTLLKQSIAAVAITFATMATPTVAATYNEIGDAGELWGTGQDVTNGTTTILGNLSPTGQDVDLFRFSWGGNIVGLTTFELVLGGVTDTVLTLVDSAGTILAVNDDSDSIGLASVVIDNLAAGTYGIAVSAYSRFPSSGVGSTLTGWSGTGFSSGAYNINVLSNGVVNAIPEPEIYAMLAAGLGLMGFVARRRKQQLSAI
jgi:hypothetical protein